MALPPEKFLLRATIIFLISCFAFKLEFWPVSHYPVFSTPIKSGEFISYRFALQYQDGRVVYPLVRDNARRMDVYLEHQFDERLKPAQMGELNFYAGLSMLRTQYHYQMLALSKLLEGIDSGYILREVHEFKNGRYEVITSQKLYEQSSQEIYAHIL